jgi:hypothetical protein
MNFLLVDSSCAGLGAFRSRLDSRLKKCTSPFKIRTGPGAWSSLKWQICFSYSKLPFAE